MIHQNRISTLPEQQGCTWKHAVCCGKSFPLPPHVWNSNWRSMIQMYSADSCKGRGYAEVVEGPSLAICSPSVSHRQEVVRKRKPRPSSVSPSIAAAQTHHHDTPFLLSSKQLVFDEADIQTSTNCFTRQLYLTASLPEKIIQNRFSGKSSAVFCWFRNDKWWCKSGDLSIEWASGWKLMGISSSQMVKPDALVEGLLHICIHSMYTYVYTYFSNHMKIRDFYPPLKSNLHPLIMQQGLKTLHPSQHITQTPRFSQPSGETLCRLSSRPWTGVAVIAVEWWLSNSKKSEKTHFLYPRKTQHVP